MKEGLNSFEIRENLPRSVLGFFIILRGEKYDGIFHYAVYMIYGFIDELALLLSRLPPVISTRYHIPTDHY